MQYRRVGRSGLLVSEIALGNWLTYRDSSDCVAAARDAGINAFHTAAAWGDGAAEEELARALAGAPRDDLVICTGVGWVDGQAHNAAGLSRKSLTASVHGSLRRLATDHIDVFQLLRFDHFTPVGETFLALSDLVRQGKILYVGTAEWSAEQITRAAVAAERYDVPLIVNQSHYSMLWRVAEAQVMPTCEREGLGQFATVPLAQGLLTGKYRPGQIPPGSRADGTDEMRKAVRPLLIPDMLERIGLLRGVADEAGLTTAQLALAWTLQRNSVASAVVGAGSAAQVAENAKSAGVTLELDVLSQVDHLLGSFVQTDPRLAWTPPTSAPEHLD